MTFAKSRYIISQPSTREILELEQKLEDAISTARKCLDLGYGDAYNTEGEHSRYLIIEDQMARRKCINRYRVTPFHVIGVASRMVV